MKIRSYEEFKNKIDEGFVVVAVYDDGEVFFFKEEDQYMLEDFPNNDESCVYSIKDLERVYSEINRGVMFTNQTLKFREFNNV